MHFRWMVDAILSKNLDFWDAMRTGRIWMDFNAFLTVFESCMTRRQFLQFFLAVKHAWYYFCRVPTYQTLTHVKRQVERVSTLGEKVYAAR